MAKGDTYVDEGGAGNANMRLTIHVADDRKITVKEVVLTGDDINADDMKVAAWMLNTSVRLVLHRNGVRRDAWVANVEARVPKHEGESKGSWIARVWREYYEPAGQTQYDLSEDLGLALSTVATYCSKFDPTKKKKRRG